MYFNIHVNKIDPNVYFLIISMYLSEPKHLYLFAGLIKATQVCDTKLKNNSTIDTSYLIVYLIPLFTALLKENSTQRAELDSLVANKVEFYLFHVDPNGC